MRIIFCALNNNILEFCVSKYLFRKLNLISHLLSTAHQECLLSIWRDFFQRELNKKGTLGHRTKTNSVCVEQKLFKFDVTGF